MKFTELDLEPEIQKALAGMNFTELTPIQEQTFTAIIENRDIQALAETGSGKTSACAIPILQKTDPAIRSIQSLILVPTRELALQYVDELDLICRHMDISPFAIYGGFSMDIQKAKLADGVHILVATPGRLIDHLYNSDLTLSDVKTLVLDEADEMLTMGFIDDVKFIMSCIVSEHQTLLFSATMPKDIEDLAAACLKDPLFIQLNLETVAPPSISHNFKFISSHEKTKTILEYLEDQKPRQTLIFCNSRRNGETLYKKMKNDQESLEYIHGGLDQSRRTSIFDRFKKCQIKVLLATDVAGRGLDFTHVTHVINYDFPQGAENYLHRTGRTGRMGNIGTALTLVTAGDIEGLSRLVKANHIKPIWLGKVPDLTSRPGSKRPRPTNSRQGRPAKGFMKRSLPRTQNK